MSTRPNPPLSLSTSRSLLLAGLIGLASLPSARAQGPDETLPTEAPPPPPVMDLTQMALDVTPPPLDPRTPQAQQQQQSQQSAGQTPASATPRAPAATPTPAPTPGRTGRRSSGRGSGSTPSPARRLDLASPAPTATPAVAASPIPAPATSPAPALAPAPVPNAVPAAAGPGIRLNFQNASLIDVLNYLSAAAGLIITQETPVTGTVNVVSQQPVSIDEAVDLLNTILLEKGFVAIRNGRILKIIASQDAPKRGEMPVNQGSDPEKIPRKDNMVTQILPVRYAEVGKLVDNLRPLLSPNSTISSNDASNAIILTDTQTNIHRMAEIIHALDTSISGISQIKVFTLRFSDAKSLADVLTQLFSPQQSNNNNGRNNQFGNLPPQFQRFLQGQQGAPASTSPQSEARQAAARVVAVADETSNSVIVAAPDEMMSTVADVIAQLDTSTSDVTETQIFRLLHADATELAAILTSLYADTGTTSSGGNNNNNRNGNQGQNRGNQGNQAQASGRSERMLLQSRVVTVADARTNSLLVSASHDTMAQIGVTIGRLDADKSKKQHVSVYTLSHSDPDNVATILRGIYSTASNSSSSTTTQPSASALTNRTINGASSDIANSLNTNSSRSSTNGR